MSILHTAADLDVVTCWCSIEYAIPRSLHRTSKEDHSTVVFCPLGHRWVSKEHEKKASQNLREELDRERRRHNCTAERLRHTEAQRRAEKAAKTRLKNRVANGVCPCCKRTFANLAKHMESKHPDYQKSEE